MMLLSIHEHHLPNAGEQVKKRVKALKLPFHFFHKNVVCVNLLQSYSNHLLGIGKIVIFKLENSVAFVIDKNG